MLPNQARPLVSGGAFVGMAVDGPRIGQQAGQAVHDGEGKAAGRKQLQQQRIDRLVDLPGAAMPTVGRRYCLHHCRQLAGDIGRGR